MHRCVDIEIYEWHIFKVFCGFWSLLENKHLQNYPVVLSCVFLKTALLKYFKLITALVASKFPLLSRPLLKVMSLPSIETANKEVKSIILESSENDVPSTAASMSRGLYVKFSQAWKV